MSLRDRIREEVANDAPRRIYEIFGVDSNPFPASNQTSANPHRRTNADAEVEDKIVTFLRDKRSQVVVVEGTQGVGKTNFLNHFEHEIQTATVEMDGYYIVRYFADPERSFDGTTRRLFEGLGTDHLQRLADALGDMGKKKRLKAIQAARGYDMQTALSHITRDPSPENLRFMMDWLMGLRILKAHRLALGVQFRLDTVESKTSALRDMIQASVAAGVLKGIFLLLDELEKQDGVLGPVAVVRYLSAVRAIVDALPDRLFLMVGITPDALLRYSVALPALRGRLENKITLEPLSEATDAVELMQFYVASARRSAGKKQEGDGGEQEIVTIEEAEEQFHQLYERGQRRGDDGVRHRAYLHELHKIAEEAIQGASRR